VRASPDRETFDRAQRRNRHGARLRAIPAGLAAAGMGIPLGVYLSPVLLALAKKHVHHGLTELHR
jgi:hypothetical protein